MHCCTAACFSGCFRISFGGEAAIAASREIHRCFERVNQLLSLLVPVSDINRAAAGFSGGGDTLRRRFLREFIPNLPDPKTREWRSISKMNDLRKESVTFLEVGENGADQRIDNFLFRQLKGVPKSHVYRILRGGEVRVNKKRVSQTYRLQPGDLLRIPPVRVAEKPETAFVPAVEFPVF